MVRKIIWTIILGCIVYGNMTHAEPATSQEEIKNRVDSELQALKMSWVKVVHLNIERRTVFHVVKSMTLRAKLIPVAGRSIVVNGSE